MNTNRDPDLWAVRAHTTGNSLNPNCYYCRFNDANIGKKYECTNLKTAYRKGPFTFRSSILNGIKCKHFRSKEKLDQDTEQIMV